MTAAPEVVRYADAVPLIAITAHGLGPVQLDPTTGTSPRRRLGTLRSSSTGLMAAVDTAGAVARQLLSLVVILGGTMTPDDMARETAGADPTEIADAVERLCTAGVLERGPDATLTLHPFVAERYEGSVVSMADQYAITSDILALICRKLHLTVPSRKQDRIDAIAGLFSDPRGRAAVIDGLPERSRLLLTTIADIAGPGVIDSEAIGLHAFHLDRAEAPRFSSRTPPSQPEIAALYDLTSRGIVGTSGYQGELWIFREAWPLLDRAFYPVWPGVPRPEGVTIVPDHPRLPSIVTLLEKALRHWANSPPAVLKNGEHRLAKADVRATAKALGSDETTVDLMSRLVIGIGLLLPNTVSASGRGRNRRVDQVWMADPDLLDAWSALSLPGRWLRLVAEWTDSTLGGEQLLANRHLVLWELASLAPDEGWPDAEAAVAWFDHRYEPVGTADAARECLADLRTLGLTATQGPIALTPLARLAMETPDEVEAAALGGSREAIVQADHTIICPPDLDPSITARLELITDVESEAGARVYRLSEERITRAVLAGDDPADICDFLDELSAVPITDTVRRLVHDAARRAGKVKVMSATTLVVTSDPADLVTACKVKAAKLVSVAPTVAVSSQTPAKVRAALDRRGLSPELVAGDTGALPAPRRSRDDAEALEISARRAREAATRFGHEGFKAHAERLTRQAAQARDPGSRLVVSAPLALTPALVEQMAGIADGSRSAEAPRTARTAPTAPSADDSRG